MGMLSIIKAVPKIVVKHGHKFAFATKKASPQILVIGGVAIAVGSFIWAVCNARKLDAALEETQQKVEEIEAKRALIDNNDKPSIREWEKEHNKAKAQGIFRVFYLVGLPAICFAGGIVMICGGHMILFRRFGALSSAFAALQSKFQRYRQMNIAEHGIECDQRYILGKCNDPEVCKITDGDDNKCLSVAEAQNKYLKNNGCGMYTFIFSEEFADAWRREPVLNISFLRSQETLWNTMLGIGKVITLKEVLDGLGIHPDPDDPMNDYIMIAGWRPNGDGDNRVDFGLFSEVNKPSLDLKENYFVLNFNCDGNLYHSTRYLKDGRKVSVAKNNQVVVS